MPYYKVTLTGSITYNHILADNEDEAIERAMEIVENCMIHDFIDDCNANEEITNHQPTQPTKQNPLQNIHTPEITTKLWIS